MAKRKKNSYMQFEVSGWLPARKNKVLGPRGGWILLNDKNTIGFFAREFKKLNDWDDAELRKYVRVTIVKGPRGKVEDYDNFVHYMKSTLDALCIPKVNRHKYGASLIVDDSPAWIEWEIEQTWGKQKSLRVEICDYEDKRKYFPELFS